MSTDLSAEALAEAGALAKVDGYFYGLFKENPFFAKIFQLAQYLRGFIFQIKDNYHNRRYFIHLGIGIIVGIVVFCNFITARAEDESSILFSLFSDEDELIVEKNIIEEKPLNNSSSVFLKASLKMVLSDNSKEETSSKELLIVNENALLKPEGLEAPGAAETPVSKENGSDNKKSRQETIYYIVKEGDTPSSVASEFGINTDTVLSANNLSENDYIKPGDRLTILPSSGVAHKIRYGETISEIAKKYNVSSESIISYNNINNENNLKAGESIIIPGGKVSSSRKTISLDASSETPINSSEKSPADIEPVTPQETPALKALEEEPSLRSAIGTGDLIWPTTTKHISQYFRWGHRALDISNDYEPIFAADNGVVEFTGWRSGYGKAIIINHQNGMETLYAHTSKIYVAPGEKVGKGEKIGQVGSTGRSTGPHLHFEIIVKGAKKNPLSYY